MSNTKKQPEAQAPVNEIRVRGRLSAVPQTRELPSGDLVTGFRVIVPRAQVRIGPSGRPGTRVDVIECSAWTPGLQSRVEAWREGDTVEVSGALRRQFYRTGGATMSRCEVEVTRAKVIRRANA